MAIETCLATRRQAIAFCAAGLFAAAGAAGWPSIAGTPGDAPARLREALGADAEFLQSLGAALVRQDASLLAPGRLRRLLAVAGGDVRAAFRTSYERDRLVQAEGWLISEAEAVVAVQLWQAHRGSRRFA